MSVDEKAVVGWISNEPANEQGQATRTHFQKLISAASQPRHASGNSCIKLCYFIELCGKSDLSSLRDFAYSRSTFLALFNFYIEWNEKNQHRSMRQVIELLSSLITVNPDAAAVELLKVDILQRLLSILSHQSAQPLVKPACKALECFLSKGTISTAELLKIHNHVLSSKKHGQASVPTEYSEGKYSEEMQIADLFVSDIFDWMSLPDTSPAAGKLLVTFFRTLRGTSASTLQKSNAHALLWQRWIRQGLAKYPECLENVKNYLLPPLFKIDKSGSLGFLQSLTEVTSVLNLTGQEMGSQALLLLSAMEVGKKLGLVDEPNYNTNTTDSSPKVRKFVILPEAAVGSLLSHASSTVRSLALSVLVSSVSSIRPFPSTILSLLQEKLDILHADTDARFRNEVLSNSKHLIERLRGATTYLMRDIDGLGHFSAESPTAQDKNFNNDKLPSAHIKSVNNDLSAKYNRKIQQQSILSQHRGFLDWYVKFLFTELVPTASYQRHITALKAIQQLIKSGILPTYGKTEIGGCSPSRSTWPFVIELFTPSSLRLLLDLLLDPFEDVRASSCSLLKFAPRKSFTGIKVPDEFKLSSDLKASLHGGSKPQYYDTIEQFFHKQTGILYDDSHSTAELDLLLSFIRVAEDLSNKTGRADVADGVSRSYELLCSLLPNDTARHGLIEALVYGLEKKITIAEQDIARAVAIAPLHGQFSALRLVWENIGVSSGSSRVIQSDASYSTLAPATNIDWDPLQQRMISCCQAIWGAVQEVLCNDSPEGHLPQDLEDMQNIDTKDVLSYSFRAVHESSNLLRSLVSKLDSRSITNAHLLPLKMFHQAGNLSFTQLSELRHRGAFSTVSLTFARCCQVAKDYNSNEDRGHSLLVEWYQGALSCISEQVSTTRRSAGIPALMTGILSSNSQFPALESVLNELKNLARTPAKLSEKDETALPQVHAMNCLKEIFKSSVLGKRCENHIAECLEIAADSLNSEIWAIRNCGLLLLRSLIDCLFGTSESKTVTEIGWDGRSIRLSYDRYPALPELLIRLLSGGTKNVNQISEKDAIGTIESVFPALDIIRRAGPPDKYRKEIYACISKHLGSKVWHVREIAARTICTLLLHGEWLAEVITLLETSGESANRLHGTLLSIRYLLERRQELDPAGASEGLPILMKRISDLQNVSLRMRGCAILDAAYDDVATIVLKIIKSGVSFTDPNSEDDLTSSLTSQTFDSLAAEKELAVDQNPLPMTTSTSVYNFVGIPLLQKSVTLRVLANTGFKGHFEQLQKLLQSSGQFDIDTALAVLEQIPIQWKVQDTPIEVLFDLRDLYLAILMNTRSTEVRAVALRDLAAVLEQLSFKPRSRKATIVNYGSVLSLSSLLKGGPNLFNAEIQITGSVMVSDFLLGLLDNSEPDTQKRIKGWGLMLCDCMSSENDFDTRYASVLALGAFYRIFYARIATHPAKPSFVSSIFALYDTLDDDDDEIRDAGASIVSHMFGISVVPMAAAKQLLPWCLQTFGDTRSFRHAVLNRLTGTRLIINEPLAAAEQIKLSTQYNDSLFVEEEQNLYTDEIRDIIAWNALILGTQGFAWGETFDNLLTWVSKGVDELIQTLEFQECRWTSRPSAFTICMRIITATNTVLTYAGLSKYRNLEEQAHDLKNKVKHLLLMGTSLNIHPLLLEELAKTIK